MTKKHASPTLRAIAAALSDAEGVTQDQIQRLWIAIVSGDKATQMEIADLMMTGSRLKEAVLQYIKADAIELAEEKLFDIKPPKSGKG